MRFPKTFVEDIPRRKFLELGLKGGLALTATPQLLTQLLAGQGTSASPVKVGADSSFLNRTISKALEKGGDFAEVYIEKRISRTILMEESKFKSAVFGISQGAGVRVIAGEKTGYAYTDEIADDKLLRAAEVASTIARGSRASKPVDIRAGSAQIIYHDQAAAGGGGGGQAAGYHQARPPGCLGLRCPDQDGLHQLLRRSPGPDDCQQRGRSP